MRQFGKIIVLFLLVVQPVFAQESEVEDVSPGEDVRAVLKMSPKDVLRLRREMQQRESAQYRDIRNNKVLSTENVVTLSHDEATPTVYLMQSAPTTLSFIDVTGTPWPIKAFEAYDGELLGAKTIENDFMNSVVLHGKLPAGATYVTIFLKSLPDPITARVEVDNKMYHRNMVFKLEQLGPETVISNETLNIAETIGMRTDPDLNSVLFGVTPFEAKKLKTNNDSVLAWRKSGSVLVRTSLSIIAPLRLELKAGSNGFVAYKLPDTTRITATNTAGKVVYITLEDE